MSKKTVKRGISKVTWLETAREALAEGGISTVRVENLAKSLNVAKSGFYWHFENRRDLLDQLLEFWQQERTDVVTASEEVLALEPKSRLVRAARMIEELELGRYDMAFRQWAKQDAKAASAVAGVTRRRLKFARAALSELGFKGDDLTMRAMLFVCYQTWEADTFPALSRKRRRALIAKRVELITSK